MDLGTTDGDDGWVSSLLYDLDSLEHLEFRSRCGNTPRYIREMIMELYSFPEIKTMKAYFGSGCEARQVRGLKDVVDGLDSGISVTWVNDSRIPDDEEREPESGGASVSLDYHGDCVES